MTSLREDVKEVAINVGYDFLIVAFIFSWMVAILLALIEVSLWIVLGVFCLGCFFFFAVTYIGKKQEEKEQIMEPSEEFEELKPLEKTD